MSTSKLIRETLQGRNWVYVEHTRGRFQSLRTQTGWFLILLFLALPWVRIHNLPAIGFDIPGRKFVLFGTVFWPQDVWLLFFLGVAAGVVLFLATAWAGRVWCGYACPQSVFTEQIFLRIERWLEGSGRQRRKIATAPKSPWVIAIKIFKHILFLLVSAVVAHTFVAYFVGAHELVYAIFHPGIVYETPMIFAGVITLLFYLDFAVLREQFCNYMCPYARFQSALLDEDSLVIGYDRMRGEPRGKKSDRAAGDCINCRKCVAVCPQGIDIRDGLQLECIHCARCVDACDDVMTRIGRPVGLIRYGSEKGFAGGKAVFWRARTIVYMVVLVLVLGGLLAAVGSRRIVEGTLVRQQGAPWIVQDNGTVLNRFTLQLVNKGSQNRHVYIRLKGLPGAQMAGLRSPVTLRSGAIVNLNAFLIVSDGILTSERSRFSLSLTSEEGGRPLILKGSFLRPAP